MKISEMIKNLQAFMVKHGDLDCWYAVDDEGNEYHEVYYDPSLYFVNGVGEVCNCLVLDEEPVARHDCAKKICVIN